MYGWKRVPDGSPDLVGKPLYESPDGRYRSYQIYDDLDGESQKLVWLIEDDDGMLGVYDTLREAVKSI